MLRRCFLLCSGHGDLFPTSKAAAHLNPEWVMCREVRHAPGKGKCYADFTTPEHHSKFQMIGPATHEVKVISTHNPSLVEMHHCVTKRPSAASVAATVAGVKNTLDTHRPKTNDTPIARANIAAKLAAEELAKTRDFMAHKRGPMERNPKHVPTVAYPSSQFYIEDRASKLRKIENSNPNGYVREYMPWETKPSTPKSSTT
ncbi:conserved hypothetical protein [Leishmania braziliensis MHOM/BR/75/M2904]|uniref:Uncharacterized protein n=2 Tax=Leishmania braziliensis TaxID=5660 RepID=A4H9E5_LEIBR|nr:conserved hypothetical protein [Leishmania braziliensis MHOM/BR/75/M2904]KAI5690955.1 hypothetical protein MNV84_02511 [Leishmania braziliensis]CAJ2470320.1 unnamed protein product [Leishmania braziliensis]CAJ2470837.1 unnamed protein product [Leishmania braziliensis]CAM38017.1 conserved hypothetical protein [Leishmania braziliensis MHOM/BR/75/M2904]SYZ64669.1 hypothetical_protein [Leishmania braziliensis MHOM/BR/75/M2904]